MRLTQTQARVLVIHELPELDPITVVLQDFGTGKGRLIVECYGSAWAHYWGAMGEKTLVAFLRGCDAPYIHNKLEYARMRKCDHKNLRAIVVALKEALKVGDPA